MPKRTEGWPRPSMVVTESVPFAPKRHPSREAVIAPVAQPIKTYSIFAVRPVDGVVGGALIDHRSYKISCSVLVSALVGVQEAKIKFEIRPSDGGVYTHELTVQAGQLATANVPISVPSCAVKILADDTCQDIYVTITAYPEA